MKEQKKLINAFIDHIGNETIIYLDEHVKDVDGFIDRFLDKYEGRIK